MPRDRAHRAGPAVAWVAALALVGAGCSSSGGDDDDPAARRDGSPAATATTAAPSTTGTDVPAGARPLAATTRDCPAGFDARPPGSGLHTGFASAGQQRSFHLLLPSRGDGPRPLFVALTGTVQEERAFLAQSRLDRLPRAGWIVVAPVRNDNGIVWPPWDAMRPPAQASLPNPDATFVEELVRCVAAHHPVDASRVFVGGVSIGGTMTNYLLRRDSELFAGGIVGSGNFVLTAPARPEPLDDMTVIVAWGGPDDRWIGCPDGRMGPEVAGEPGCVDVSFVADAAAASQFYDAEPDVRQVACTADVGHIWIASGTEYMARVLLAHPKGTRGPVRLPRRPPAGFTCTTEAFTG